ncbi:MAG TPA: hypothetical protein VFS30_06390 [Dehalococcoidia bacterium]|nr:hypothetical protein [Dehalococcoidia bacterium]
MKFDVAYMQDMHAFAFTQKNPPSRQTLLGRSGAEGVGDFKAVEPRALKILNREVELRAEPAETLDFAEAGEAAVELSQETGFSVVRHEYRGEFWVRGESKTDRLDPESKLAFDLLF